MIKEHVMNLRSGEHKRVGEHRGIEVLHMQYSVLMFGVCTEEKDSVTISYVQFTIKNTIRFIYNS